MRADQVEIGLEEYKSLRAEIARIAQAQNGLLGAALTATAAIGGVGLGKSGNRLILLVLPFVLSGLAILYIRSSIQIRTVGSYVRTELWPFLQTAAEGAVPSWEKHIANKRSGRRRSTPAGLVDFVGQLLVFGVPGIGALALTHARASSASLTIAWWLGVAAMVLSATMTIAVDARVLTPADRS